MGFLSKWVRADDNHLESAFIDAGLLSLMSSQYNKLAVAAIFRARQMTADVAGGIPYRIGESLVPPLNTDETLDETLVPTVLSLQDCGDAYWVRDGDDWYVIDPGRITVKWDAGKLRRRYFLDSSQPMRTSGMAPNLIVMSVNRGITDDTGHGWMESGRIQGILAAQSYAEEFFKHSGNPTGLLRVPAMMSADESDRLLEQWTQARSVRTPAVVSSNIEWESTSFSPSDSEWVDTHRMSTGDVALLAGIPGALLDYNTPGASLTYQNVGDLLDLWLRFGLGPYYLRRIVEALTKVNGGVVTADTELLILANLISRSQSAYQLTLAGYEPDTVADIVGLDGLRHTGFIPTSLQSEEEMDAGANPVPGPAPGG